ncbi:hypothetical protein BC827DRAFT_1378032 [Russula dissimulans]|nr:hypothetical protein BC827DRAFT_1378032 [Russula dissimulans]
MSGRVQVRERRWVLSSHVSLGGLMFLILSRLIIWSIDETSRKKKQLNEGEIALRREETARKRKHLSKKNLEDEKANQLASAEDRTSATHTGNGTPPAEGEVNEE